MAEQQSSGFTVVDKRQSVQAPPSDTETGFSPDVTDSAPPASETEINDGTTLHTPSDGSSTESSSTSVLADATTSETTNSMEPDEPEMPDPALLLSMIGMQMDTRMLATALIAIFDGHAWRGLGLIANPMTGEVRKDLPSAQLAIDTVAFLLGKIESSLPDSERRDAQRRLSDLRMNYLNKLREP